MTNQPHWHNDIRELADLARTERLEKLMTAAQQPKRPQTTTTQDTTALENELARREYIRRARTK